MMTQLMTPRDDSWGIIRLQNCILNIAKYIDEFCEQRDISYCLMGGSALGAARHGGFIPWDDDLDIFMRPADYARFRDSFMREGDHRRYYLQEWGSKAGHPTMAKLRLNQSSYSEPALESWNIHKGVFVDIFILHSCADSLPSRLNQYFWSRYLVLKALANNNYSRRGVLAGLILKPLKWLPRRAFVDHAIRQVYRHDDIVTRRLCHWAGRAGYGKGLYDSAFFHQTKRVPFETISLRVPARVEDYLKSRWGDYMKLPDQASIRYCQHSARWSLDTPFDGYNEENIYPDEDFLI